MAEDIEIIDEGSAGTPGHPTDYQYVHTSTDVSYSSAADALGNRYSASQMDQISTMLSSNLGISLSALTGSATGTNNQMVQWSEPRPEPSGPTTNWENVELTTPDGMTVRIATQITGPEGTYGSTDNNGGTGTSWIVVTDADGNTSWLQLNMSGGEIVYQEFHGEDLVRDNAEVSIEGPTAVNEDTSNQWKVVVGDSNLPEETPDIFEVEWTGAPAGSWQAPGGNPASGSGESFSTKYTQPGSQMIMVEATRDYQFKTYRAEPNPDYVEGTSPLEDAFISVLKIMTGTVRGSASLTIAVSDITPPDLNFIVTAAHEGNSINVKEAPMDKEPPKTQSLDLSGNNFQLQVGTPFSLTRTSLPAGEAIFVGPALDPSLLGIVVRQHERFKLSAEVKDNATAVNQIDCKWSIENVTQSREIIPEGQVEYAVVRTDNVESMDNIIIHVSAADIAGNVTILEIPLLVLARDSNVESLALETKRSQ
jgi:hypothetical protein